MDRTIRILSAMFISFLFVLNFSFANQNDEIEAVPGEYIIKLKREAYERFTSPEANTLLSQNLHAAVIGTIPEQNLVIVRRASFEVMSSALENLAANSMVELVEPNYIYYLNKSPNDPLLDNVWGLENQSTDGVDINAKLAWDITTGSHEGPLVAVIDTGIDLDHPDLLENLWVNQMELNGQEGIDDDNNGIVDDIRGYNAIDNNTNPDDGYNHGTHCAGTIGARGDNGIGVVGVNWNTKILPVKIFANNGQTNTAAIVRGIEYAIKMEAKVMNNSWGGGAFSQIILDSVKKTHEIGALFIVAAGNSAGDNDVRPHYPANYDSPNIISVAAIDKNGAPARFTNFGKTTVHLAAPGVNIMSTVLNGKYDYNSGTSMAAPHVTGVAALLWSHEPSLTNLEVKQRILNNTKKLSSLSQKTSTGGMLDAHATLLNTGTNE